MLNIDEWTITKAVLAAQSDCKNPRLKELMTGIIEHLHNFAREYQLTEDEWVQGIKFLTDVGHITDDNRQEFILLSDTLGLSTLVTAQNHRKPEGCSEATVLGPFFVEGSPEYKNGDDISNGAHGKPCFVTGSVKALDGRPIANAEILVWQSDDDGMYDVQRPELDHHQARGTIHSLADGSFHFKSILAEAYPIPHDGPVGKMLENLGRHPWRPAHLHFLIRTPGYETLITHIFKSGCQYLESDAVFGVRSSLIVDWNQHNPGVAPDGSKIDSEFYTVHYDFVMNPKT